MPDVAKTTEAEAVTAVEASPKVSSPEKTPEPQEVEPREVKPQEVEPQEVEQPAEGAASTEEEGVETQDGTDGETQKTMAR